MFKIESWWENEKLDKQGKKKVSLIPMTGVSFGFTERFHEWPDLDLQAVTRSSSVPLGLPLNYLTGWILTH